MNTPLTLTRNCMTDVSCLCNPPAIVWFSEFLAFDLKFGMWEKLSQAGHAIAQMLYTYGVS